MEEVANPMDMYYKLISNLSDIIIQRVDDSVMDIFNVSK